MSCHPPCRATTRLLVLLFLVLPTSSTAVIAQQDSVAQPPGDQDTDRKVSYFLDRSYIFYEFPAGKLVPADKTLLFEAQIAPNFFVFQNVNDKTSNIKRNGWTNAFSADITPMVRLRQTNSYSQPVRTPSYMPKLTLQWFLMKEIDSNDTVPRRFAIMIPQLTIGHHSNGQNGCLYLGYSLQMVGESQSCKADAGTDTVHKEVNRQDGSFSTNYLRAGIFAEWLDATRNNEFSRSFGFGVQIETNPTWSGFGIDPAMKENYGRTRTISDVEAIFSLSDDPMRAKRLRIEGNLEYISGAPSSVSPCIFWLETAMSFPGRSKWLGGYGAFVRYYRGQDYYNLGFLTQINVLQFGMIIDGSRFGSFPFPKDSRSAK